MKTSIKQFLLVAGLVILTSSVTLAQTTPRKAGIKGGFNVSNIYIDDVDDENARLGFNAGVFGEIISSEAFGLQAELLYSTKGAKWESDGLNQETEFHLNYLDVPVLAVFKLGESVEIHAGAYGGFLLNSSISTEGDLGSGTDDLDKDNFRAFDYGLLGGIGFNFGALQVGARYNYGLQKIADSDVADAVLGNSKNSYGQVFVALNLNHQ